ncbi:putative transcriptional regulator [Thalassoporum mexicanum PCC 7367]|uniref:ATP-binding protein n=1 Tax=Thalassoporum mexicanum TaxID=3457544 RepID=UPI00029FF7C7|nr:RNA-binding domain-containing protein [Pseudanabaena sp. PCC 7367]AFY71189.1 putative transcriptional regulator [Pseudanabaena sp. PCC 7367]
MNKDDETLKSLLLELVALAQETEWVEFKENNSDPQEIGEYFSALSNSALIVGRQYGYLVWGVKDGNHEIVGTDFCPREKRIKGQELENWLSTKLKPRINFKMHEFLFNNKKIVIAEIPCADHIPVKFKSEEFVRIGSYKKKLSEHPEKEREIWMLLSRLTFEGRLTYQNLPIPELLELIDFSRYFELIDQRQPEEATEIISRMVAEKFIQAEFPRSYSITNLGAILLARRLDKFETLSRKRVRVITYKGCNKIETIREIQGGRGYAIGFQGLISYITSQLPQNEVISQALRKEVPMYPEIAIRELVANALIHQDFNMSGTGPMIEIFSDRIEITNPGIPLIDTLRFIDCPPQSRNESLAAFMRRIKICEERGSGIDKVIREVEIFQLPAPEFEVTGNNHTRAILYAHKDLAEMDNQDKIRACYQHACLRYVSRDVMTNSSLRERFSIEDKNQSIASRIIAETLNADLIKRYDPSNKSKKLYRYVPFWA